MSETLHISAGARGLLALLSRAHGLSSSALVRFQEHEGHEVAGGETNESSIDAFVTTPFEVLASRRITGSLSKNLAVTSAQSIMAQLNQGENEATVTLEQSGAEASWPGSLPPTQGFVPLEILPVTVVRELADQGQELARQFSGPLGPPKSLLDQTVVTVKNEDAEAAISMRSIFAATSLGLIPGLATHPEIPRHLRVSKCGRWTRIDAPFGSIYQASGLNLLF